MLEASFEFGATAALDIGVASGEVHIMAGIYFAMQRKEPANVMAATLSGYLRMGGSLSVLGIDVTRPCGMAGRVGGSSPIIGHGTSS